VESVIRKGTNKDVGTEECPTRNWTGNQMPWKWMLPKPWSRKVKMTGRNSDRKEGVSCATNKVI